jgi:hypothetical protein
MYYIGPCPQVTSIQPWLLAFLPVVVQHINIGETLAIKNDLLFLCGEKTVLMRTL